MNLSKNDYSQQSLFEIMLEFVRAAVLNRDPVIQQKKAVDWDKLMDLSTEHGLLTWVWDGICKLPFELLPPRQQRINWGLSAQEIWDHYEKQQQVLIELISICNQHNIRILLLKGIELSYLYPKPQSRYCGDIDIYTFDDFDNFNSIFEKQLKYVEGKHTVFYIDGVMVENHHEFLNPDTRRKIEISNYFKSHLNEIRITDSGYFLMDPMTNLLFLIVHSLKHLNVDAFVPMHAIMDFALFIDVHRKELSPSKYCNELKKLKLEKGCEVLLYMSEFLLGIRFDEYKSNLIAQKHVKYLNQWLSNGYYKLSLSEAIEGGLFCYLNALRDFYCRRRYTLRAQRISIELKIVTVNIVRAFFHLPSGVSFVSQIKQSFRSGLNR